VEPVAEVVVVVAAHKEASKPAPISANWLREGSQVCHWPGSRGAMMCQVQPVTSDWRHCSQKRADRLTQHLVVL
jgi:hypothetical protein